MKLSKQTERELKSMIHKNRYSSKTFDVDDTIDDIDDAIDEIVTLHNIFGMSGGIIADYYKITEHTVDEILRRL